MKNKMIRLVGTGLLLFTLLAPLIPLQQASAAVTDPGGAGGGTLITSKSLVADQLYSYEAYAFMSSVQGQTCAGDWAADIGPTDASSGTWFTGSSNNWRSGHIISPDAGTQNCNNGDGWIDKALGLWGYDGNKAGFLCKVGYVQKVSSSTGLAPGCTSGGSGDGGFHAQNVNPGNVGKAIKDAAYGGKEPVLTDAMKYALYYNSFLNGCKAKQEKPWSSATSDERNGDNKYRIPVVGADGKPTDYLYSADGGHGTNVTMGANDVKGVDELSCGALESALQNNPAWAIAFGQAVLANPANLQSVGTNASGTSATNAPVDCRSDSLNWLVCPLITLGLKAATALDNFMMSQLNTDTDPIFGNSESAGGFYTAWNSFRIIATAIIVIAGLIMVASQAFGFDFLDAYTIRKTLPRLLVAIIGISLSWPIMKFVIELTNTVGFDIRNLMYAPFDKPGATISISTSILTTLGAGAALFIMGPAALTFILTALLAVIVGFLILVVRQIAIIMLVVLAPIGIAFYVLPNTQRIWKLWSENFIGLMLMFPIISALIAMGHIFAAVTVARHTGNNPADIAAQGLALVAYFLPYFLLPLAARLATGVIGTLAGFVNNRGKGAFDRLKKVRQNATATRMHDLKTGNRFHGGTDTNWRGKINRGLGATANINQAGYNPTKMRSRMQAFGTTHTMDSALEALEKNQDMRAIKDNDTILWAAMSGRGTDADVRNYLSANTRQSASEIEQNVALVRRARRSMGDEVFKTALPLAQAGTGTGYADAGDMLETIAQQAEGNRPLAQRMAFAARSMAKGSGREDLGAYGAGTMLEQLENAQSGRAVDARALTLDALRSSDSVSVVRQRDVGLRQMTNAATSRIQELHAMPIRSADQDAELGRLTAVLENLQQTGGMYAAPERVETITQANYDTSRERGTVQSVAESIPPNTYDVATGLRNRNDERAEGYREQKQTRYADPNDPNAPH
jgi:hypothetical protein